MEFEILSYDLLLTTVDIFLPPATCGYRFAVWAIYSYYHYDGLKVARKWEGRPRHYCRHGQTVGRWKVAEGQRRGEACGCGPRGIG